MGTAIKYKWLIAVIAIVVLFRALYAWNAAKEEQKKTELSIFNGLNVNYILTPKNVETLSAPIDTSFEVTLTGSIILRCGSELVEVEPTDEGTVAHKISVNGSAPDSYALDQDGALLTISGNFFGQLEDSSFSKALPLPAKGMQLKSSMFPGTVYLFGGNGKASNRLYAISSNGKFTIIAEVPDPIVSVSDTKDGIYIATKNEIYHVNEKSPTLVIRLPANADPITSMEVSSDNRLLYYATAKKVYVLHGLAAISIINNAGGHLRLRGDKLYLWDAQQKILVSITSLNNLLL